MQTGLLEKDKEIRQWLVQMLTIRLERKVATIFI